MFLFHFIMLPLFLLLHFSNLDLILATNSEYVSFLILPCNIGMPRNFPKSFVNGILTTLLSKLALALLMFEETSNSDFESLTFWPDALQN
ncbi:Uncharacterized protein TCM_004135 [Theobroma cacao]|uniref:Uncharacterized protein n=1 Tax=Theobroma cacao TaxID=3641 RepID=A0A061DQZ3_THECC|nr:Uncharacterized protein TCM_004135 [Theobroma cacao]